MAALAGAVAFAALAIGPPGAWAASVSVRHRSLDESSYDYAHYEAAHGEANRLTVSATAGDQLRVFLTESGAPLTARSGCSRGPRPRTATCTSSAEFGFPRVNLGDGNDTARLSGAVYQLFGDPRSRLDYSVSGGPGNDVISLGTSAYGRLYGNAGNDRLSGGARSDRLVGGPGNDRLFGGAAIDVTSYADHASAIRIDLRRAGPQGSAGERDYLYGIEQVIGGRGPDVMFGSAAPNRIEGGPGNDTIDTVGGGTDRVFCSTGVDTVRADRRDVLVACERMTRIR
jgi:hypothetical protein